MEELQRLARDLLCPPDLAAVDMPIDLRASWRALVDVASLNSPRLREKRGLAARRNCDGMVIEFEKRFCTRMGKLYSIPVYCRAMRRKREEQAALSVMTGAPVDSPLVHGYGCEIVHLNRSDLSFQEWEMFGHVGKEVCKIHTFDMTWGGDLDVYQPELWFRTGWVDLVRGEAGPNPESGLPERERLWLYYSGQRDRVL